MATPNPQLKARTEGLSLLQPLQPLVSALTVDDDESYLEADGLLGRIRSARGLWKVKMDPILTPAKVTVYEAKKTLDAAKALFNEVDNPMLELESVVKATMRDFKLREAAHQRLLEEQAAAEQRRFAAMAEEKRLKEEQATTAQMRARLATQRADLLAMAGAVKEEAKAAPQVKGTSSAARRVQKWRVVDKAAVVKKLIELEMWGHLTLDLSTLTIPQIQQLPGIEVYTDITIAGR